MRKKADKTNREIVGKSVVGIMKGVVEGELGKARKASDALKQFLGSINITGEMKDFLVRQIVNISRLQRKGYEGSNVPVEDFRLIRDLEESLGKFADVKVTTQSTPLPSRPPPRGRPRRFVREEGGKDAVVRDLSGVTELLDPTSSEPVDKTPRKSSGRPKGSLNKATKLQRVDAHFDRIGQPELKQMNE